MAKGQGDEDAVRRCAALVAEARQAELRHAKAQAIAEQDQREVEAELGTCVVEEVERICQERRRERQGLEKKLSEAMAAYDAQYGGLL